MPRVNEKRIVAPLCCPPMNAPRPFRLCWEDFPVGHVMEFGSTPVSREAVIAFASQGSAGIDPLRWHQPVRPGDTLRARMDILEARPMNSKPHLGLVRSHRTVRNQRDETVMTMDGWGMFLRRPAAAAPSQAAA
jgi:acyl dehydratase